jgi:uncharacterized membrane protein YcaP (DUF421 family)
MRRLGLLEGVIMLLSIILKSCLIYFVVMAIIKFMGKREIGQLSVFDFAVLLVIADILVTGMEDTKVPFYYYIFPIAALGIIQKTLAFIMLKIVFIRDFFEGKQSNIIVEGVLQLKEMRKQNYNVDDLLVQLRLKNIRSFSEVRYAILETNGEISVFKYSDYEGNSQGETYPIAARTFDALPGASSSDSVPSQPEEIYPFPLIISGKVKKENLQILNLTEKWLEHEVKMQGKTVKSIMYANYENKKLFIIKTKEA